MQRALRCAFGQHQRRDAGARVLDQRRNVGQAFGVLQVLTATGPADRPHVAAAHQLRVVSRRARRLDAAVRAQELEHGIEHRRPLEPGQMHLAFERDHPGTRNARRHVTARLERNRAVLDAVDHQRGRFDLRGQLTHVHAVEHRQQLGRGVGGSCRKLATGEAPRFVFAHARRQDRRQRLCAEPPVRTNQADHRLLHLWRCNLRAVRERAVEHQARDELRVARGESGRDGSTERAAYERDPFGTDMLDHALQLGNFSLEREVGTRAITQADAGVIVAHECEARGQALVKGA